VPAGGGRRALHSPPRARSLRISALTQRSPRSERVAIVFFWIFGLAAWSVTAAIALVQADLFPAPTGREDLWTLMQEDGAWIVAGFAAVFGTFTIGAALWAGRRLRTERAIVAMMQEATSTRGTASRTAPPPPRRSSGTAPPANVEAIRARKLKRPKVKYRKVTPERNVVGRTPVRIVHLWVFANEQRLTNYLEGAWREFGVVHVLRSASSVTPKELKAARAAGAPGSLLAQTPKEVDRSMAAAGVEVETKRMKTLRGYGITSGSTFDRYGSYRVHSLLCNDAVWRYAVDALLARADVVTMDLSGFSERHEGAEYEIGRLIDIFPADRMVFLVDPWTKQRFLEDRLRQAWAAMSADSPNRTATGSALRIVTTDTISSSSNRQGSSSSELVAVRADARRIMHHLLGQTPS